VFWACGARPKHPTPRFIEKLQKQVVANWQTKKQSDCTAITTSVCKMGSDNTIFDGSHGFTLSLSKGEDRQPQRRRQLPPHRRRQRGQHRHGRLPGRARRPLADPRPERHAPDRRLRDRLGSERQRRRPGHPGDLPLRPGGGELRPAP